MEKKKPGQIFLTLSLLMLVCFGILLPVSAQAAQAQNTPLDPDDPVMFYGETLEYGGKTITLGDHDIYIDGTLSDAECAKYDHVYNDFKKAYESGAMKNGTETSPMNVWIAPYVYWIDDPDDPAIREGINGDPVPYGLWMNCSHLSLNGLSDSPENVVLAVNRGQNAGAKGNFTMFYINGAGTHTENLTMGNYCCMDLVYPLKPELNREKRTNTITQSQLCLTNGEKITAENCNFVSRLNSCPFVGGTRIFFQDCHFECTDDSLPTSAVYLNCDFDLYSSRPFYNTSGTGSVMLGCDFHIKHNSNQYLTKFDGVVTIIDSTFYSEKKDQYIGWVPDPGPSLRCYSANITVQYDYEEDGQKKSEVRENYTMDADQPYVNVNITGTKAMDAYRLEYGGRTVYNVYNLLRGSDQYDPLNQKELLTKAGEEAGIDYTNLPVMLSCDYSVLSVTKGDTKKISTYQRTFSGASEEAKGTVTWRLEDKLKDYLTLKDNGDGTCEVTCRNETVNIVRGMVYATDAAGREAGCYVAAEPETQPAHSFVSAPRLTLSKNGAMTLNYTLSNQDKLEDHSKITWYRCSDAKGQNRLPVAVTNQNIPVREYTLSLGDVGYYMEAVIEPEQQCTYSGNAVTVVFPRTITKADVTADPYTLSTDFTDAVTEGQSRVIPGFWIRDAKGYPGSQAWMYGDGVVGYGNAGFSGLMPVQFNAIEDGKSKTIRRSRLFYVPPAGTYGDMDITWVVNPEKTAGQGFGSAGQYMDLFIKMDAAKMTGYALRVERVAATGKGVQLSFVKYNSWDSVEYLGDKVLTSAFNATCTIHIAAKGNRLSAEMTTTRAQNEGQAGEKLIHEPVLQAEMKQNTFGGLGVYYTGSCPAGNRVMFNNLLVKWDKAGTVLKDPVAVDLKDPSAGGQGGNSNNNNKGTNDEKKPQKNSSITVLKKGKKFTAGSLRYKVTKKAVKGKGSVSIAGVKRKTLKSVKIAGTVSYKGVKYKIVSIEAKAFAKCKKLKKITITGKYLTKVGKNALKGIHKKCVIRVPKSKLKKYKKIFKRKGQAKTVKIRKR